MRPSLYCTRGTRGVKERGGETVSNGALSLVESLLFFKNDNGLNSISVG